MTNIMDEHVSMGTPDDEIIKALPTMTNQELGEQLSSVLGMLDGYYISLATPIIIEASRRLHFEMP